MQSVLLVTIADPLTIPVINVLCHAMKLGSLRPKRRAQNLMTGAVLVVVVVGVDVVMVEVAVGVTVPILGVNGVPTKVILLLPVLIHLRVMVSKSEMESV
jgi:hypothetical protein